MKPAQHKKIIISGGGTGGHIFPALAIADTIKVKAPKTEILFVGATGRMEMTRVPERGYKIIGLNISGLERTLSLKNVLLPFRLLISVVKAFRLIKKFKPTVVIGTGGYVSAPVLFSAVLAKVPTIIQEQNSTAGLTNKILGRFVKNICVAYPGMEDYFPKYKILYTGNPVRKEILDFKNLNKDRELQKLKLQSGKKTVLCLGGSLGAHALNEAILEGLTELDKHNIQVLWQCGNRYYKYGLSQIKKKSFRHARIVPFIKSIASAYAVADIIISRAGAITLSELAIVAKPLIIVPSPHVTNNHQTANALSLVKRQGAIYVSNSQVGKELIPSILDLLKNEAKQDVMSKNLRKIAKLDAANIISQLALSY